MQRCLYLAYAFVDPMIFAHIFFEEHMELDSPPHHAEFLNAFDPYKTGQRINILAPRGSAKSFRKQKTTFECL